MEYQIWEWVTTVVHKWTSPSDEWFWILGCWSEVDLAFVCCFLESWPTSQYHPASYPHPAQHPSLKSMLLLSRGKSNNKTNFTGLFSRITIPWKPWSFNGFASFVPWKMGSFLFVVLTQCWDSHRTTNKNWNWLFHSFTHSLHQFTARSIFHPQRSPQGCSAITFGFLRRGCDWKLGGSEVELKCIRFHRQNDDEQLDFGALYFQLCFQTFCQIMFRLYSNFRTNLW